MSHPYESPALQCSRVLKNAESFSRHWPWSPKDWLQCSRVLKNAERARGANADVSDQDIASMQPRSEERGETMRSSVLSRPSRGFNAAAF